MTEMRSIEREKSAPSADSRTRCALVFGVLGDESMLDWPGRNQLMLALADHGPVVLLLRKDSRYAVRPRLEQARENVWFVHNALALRTSRAGRRSLGLAGAIDGRWLRRTLAGAGFDDAALWLTVPDPALAEGFPRARFVYDCMDPNFLPEGQAEFDRIEFALAARARVVFASAGTLYRRMKQVNHTTYLLPNAAPTTPPQGGLPRPRELAGRTGPVAGYLGTIDWRFDAEHVSTAAEALPEVTFAIVGRVNADQEHRIARLRTLPNVILPGPVSRQDGEAWTQTFDVGLIPFVPGPTNDAINPVKMFMYLAAGLPVVSTAVAECVTNPWVDSASDPQAFATTIRRVLADRGTGRAQQRRDYALANTWEHRANDARHVLARHHIWSPSR